MSSRNYTLRKHALDLPINEGVGILVGKSKSGKTALLMDIINRAQLRAGGPVWHKVIIFSRSAKFQMNYFGGIPERDIISDPDEFGPALVDIKERQTGMEVIKPVLVVFDDVIGCFKGGKDNGFGRAFSEYVTSSRHFGVNVFILTQYLLDRSFNSPEVRGNISWMVCFQIEDTSRDKFVQLMGVKKSDGEGVCRAAWSEPYRAVCVDKSASVSDSDRISFIKIDMSKTPKLTIRYRD